MLVCVDRSRESLMGEEERNMMAVRGPGRTPLGIQPCPHAARDTHPHPTFLLTLNGSLNS